ncbi:MAG: hypothetical protein L0Y67_02810 [Gammaproteobacteria bacterium]|nr:hypothetical protein [Gammaproteobacteria bacterium]
MGTKHQKMQSFIRYYKEKTGNKEVNMHGVAQFAADKGWSLPTPPNPIDLLAKEFSQAAREEIRRDKKTGKPYRANHAYSTTQGTQQLTFWFDIDEAPPRHIMVKSLVNRREQMVGDGLQLTLDADHWNSIHPNEEPIVMPLDFTDDVEWRKNAPDEKVA